jgi:hypothetical protein
VTDVSMLGSVHILELSDCRGVTDVSMIGSVNILNNKSINAWRSSYFALT